MPATEGGRGGLAAAMAGAALGASLMAWWAWHGADGDPPTAPTPPARATAAAAPPTGPGRAVERGIDATPVASAPHAVATPAPPVACARQHLGLLQDGVERRACVDEVDVRMTGSLRRVVARGSGRDGLRLAVDLAGGEVLQVVWTGGDGRAWTCARSACTGAVLGPADARGARALQFDGARLAGPVAGAGVGAGAGATPAGIVLSGELRLPADDAVAGLACDGPSLVATDSAGGRSRWCGQGGAGVDVVAPDRRRYHLQDPDGRLLAITVDASERIVRVEADGARCIGASCAGASTSSPDPSDLLAERSFAFGRTVLTRPGRTAGSPPALVLDGQLTLPAQQ